MRLVLEILLRLRRLYWRILRPTTRGARAIVLDAADNVLLVRHKYGNGWFLPGGRIRVKESPEIGLRRELSEELGLTGFTMERLLGTYENNQEGKKDTITVFVVRAAERPKKQHFEIESTEYFALDALPDSTSPGTKRRIREYRGLDQQKPTW